MKLTNRESICNFIERNIRIYYISFFIFLFVRGMFFEEAWFTLMPISTAFFVIIEFLRAKNKKIDFRAIVLFGGLLSFYLFWGDGIPLGIGTTSMSVVFFLFGSYVSQNQRENESYIEGIIVCFSLGIYGLGVLQYIPFFVNRLTGGEWIEGWSSFWKHDFVARTNFELYFAPTAGLIVYSLCLIYKKIKLGYVMLVISASSICISCFAQGRMVLCGSAITLCVIVFMTAIKEWSNKTVRNVAIFFFLACVCGGILGLLAYVNNWFGIATIFDNSWLNGSMGLFHNIRFNMKIDQLKLLTKFPFGRCTVPLQYSFYNNLPYDDPHDSWLFIARKGGIIPFCLVLCFTINIFCDLYKLWNNKFINLSTLCCVSGTFISINLYCWCESVIHGRPYMWAYLCFVGGIIRGLGMRNEKER